MRLPRRYIRVKAWLGAFPSCYPGLYRFSSLKGLCAARSVDPERTERPTGAGTPEPVAGAYLLLSALLRPARPRPPEIRHAWLVWLAPAQP